MPGGFVSDRTERYLLSHPDGCDKIVCDDNVGCRGRTRQPGKSINMKRLTVIILSLLIIFSLFSCGVRPRPETDGTTEAVRTETESETPAATESVPETDGSKTEDGSETEEGTEGPDPAAPLLWRVTDADGHSLFLFGTCHVGDERSDAVFSRVVPVLDECDALAVEFDVVAYEKNVVQMAKDTAQYLLTDGSTVSDYMPQELYDRSCELLERAEMYSAIFDRYNLAWWAQMVDSAIQELYSDLDTDKAMDSMLIDHAYGIEIPVLEVESAEFQLTLLNTFDNELYLLLIEDALDGADTYGDDLDELFALWLSGDRDAFWEYLSAENGEEELSADYTEEQIALIEDYNRRLLDDRNLGMFDRAVEYLGSGQTVFFAVGAAHMANGVGLVQLLTDAGYTVEEVNY